MVAYYPRSCLREITKRVNYLAYCGVGETWILLVGRAFNGHAAVGRTRAYNL